MIKSIDLTHIEKIKTEICISGSKSLSNRALILQKLFPDIQIFNLSDADDTIYLQKALNSDKNLIDIGHAGTAMRFLTAYFAGCNKKSVTLTGSKRMQERPIKILVDVMRILDADITYTGKEGFPPLFIKGKKLKSKPVTLKADVSSQYISALLLIAPILENGLELTLQGEVTSLPYIKMTLNLLKEIGVETQFVEKKELQNIWIKVHKHVKQNLSSHKIQIESDWSSASYFYSIIALLGIDSEITLSHFQQKSIQGDQVLVDIYKAFGVETIFEINKIIIKKTRKNNSFPKGFYWNGINSPDLAQTIALTCVGLGIECFLTGLHTLKIKETDRLKALKTELEKLGSYVEITDNSIKIIPASTLNQNVLISTYDDHRMAMAFAPLALKTPIQIENPRVVEKSYKKFWEDFESLVK